MPQTAGDAYPMGTCSRLLPLGLSLGIRSSQLTMFPATLLHQDLLLLRQTAEVTEEAARNPALRSALVLLLVWARAHSLDEGADGLSPGFLVQLLLYTAAKV